MNIGKGSTILVLPFSLTIAIRIIMKSDRFYRRFDDVRNIYVVINATYPEYESMVDTAYDIYGFSRYWRQSENGYLEPTEDQLRSINTIYSLLTQEPPDLDRLTLDDIANIEIAMVRTFRPEVKSWRDVDL